MANASRPLSYGPLSYEQFVAAMDRRRNSREVVQSIQGIPEHIQVDYCTRYILAAYGGSDRPRFARDPRARNKSYNHRQPWISTNNMTYVQITDRIIEEILRQRRVDTERRWLETLTTKFRRDPAHSNSVEETEWVRALPSDFYPNEEAEDRFADGHDTGVVAQARASVGNGVHAIKGFKRRTSHFRNDSAVDDQQQGEAQSQASRPEVPQSQSISGQSDAENRPQQSLESPSNVSQPPNEVSAASVSGFDASADEQAQVTGR